MVRGHAGTFTALQHRWPGPMVAPSFGDVMSGCEQCERLKQLICECPDPDPDWVERVSIVAPDIDMSGDGLTFPSDPSEWVDSLAEIADKLLGVPHSALGPNLHVSLHTAEPIHGQHEYECSYPGYKRVVVPRTENNWIIRVNQGCLDVTNARVIEFPMHTGGIGDVAVAEYWAVGTDDGQLLGCAPLGVKLHIGVDYAPTFQSGALVIGEAELYSGPKENKE